MTKNLETLKVTDFGMGARERVREREEGGAGGGEARGERASETKREILKGDIRR